MPSTTFTIERIWILNTITKNTSNNVNSVHTQHMHIPCSKYVDTLNFDAMNFQALTAAAVGGFTPLVPRPKQRRLNGVPGVVGRDGRRRERHGDLTTAKGEREKFVVGGRRRRRNIIITFHCFLFCGLRTMVW